MLFKYMAERHLLLIFLIVFTQVNSISYSAEIDKVSLGGGDYIELIDFSKCNENRDFHEHCEANSGKYLKWSKEKKRIVLDTFSEIGKFPKTHILIKKLKDSGVKKIQVTLLDDKYDFAVASQFNSTAILALSEKFFVTEHRFKNISERGHIILHESFHFLDKFIRYNDEYFFRQLAKSLAWSDSTGRNDQVDRKKFKESFKIRNRLIKAGKFEKANEADFNFSRGLGLPSLYSMVKLKEYFAELGSFLVHDSKLVKDLPIEVIKWMHDKDLDQFLIGGTIKEKESDFSSLPTRKGIEGIHYIGNLSRGNRFICTVFLIEHGVALTEKSCFKKGFSEKNINEKLDLPNIILTFETGEQSIIFSGLSFRKLILGGVGKNWAMIKYDPAITFGKINIPKIRLVKKDEILNYEKRRLFTVGFPSSKKIRRPRLLKTKVCQVIGKFREAFSYQTNCSSFGNSLGSPVYLEDVDPLTGELLLVGILSGTEVGTSRLFKDIWGSYGWAQFFPLYDWDM